MAHYAVYLHSDLLERMPKGQPQRQKIISFIRSLAENPFIEGEFSDKDHSSRLRHIKIIGDYAITYWADHPVKAVMVVDISLVDR